MLTSRKIVPVQTHKNSESIIIHSSINQKNHTVRKYDLLFYYLKVQYPQKGTANALFVLVVYVLSRRGNPAIFKTFY